MHRQLFRWAPVAIICTILAACEPADNDPGPGGVTVSEARELDEAAAMLDSQRIDMSGETETDADMQAEPE